MDLINIDVVAIPEAVREWCEKNAHSRSTRFCAWLEYINGEMVERDFATRVKNKKVGITEVVRRSTADGNVIAKNLYYTWGSSYNAIYEAKDKYISCGGYPICVFAAAEFDVWQRWDGMPGYGVTFLNTELIPTVDEFKYCGYSDGDVISYLNYYRKNNSVEFFGKLGLRLSPVLIRKAQEDGKFRRFLWQNHNQIALYGVQAALFAYKQNIGVEEARRACHVKNQQCRYLAYHIPQIKGTKIDRMRLFDYLDDNDIDHRLYNDYLEALKALNCDLDDTKHVYPRDFMRAHDERIEEYNAYKAKLDRKKRAKLYREFKKVSMATSEFETVGEDLRIVVPKTVSDLQREGKKLHHCVGRLGYDKKMAEGKSLIMFCRKNTEPDTPFVTIEYDLKTNKVRQCYGDHNSKPGDDIMIFINAWALMVAQKLKEVANG